ncbi:MAG: hypothetical protein AB7N76_02885 [Planctomycetota bacterium]
MQQYGCVALLIYLSTSLIVGVPLAWGIGHSLDTTGLAFWGAVLGGAFAGLKASQLPRLALTAALTPVIGRMLPESVLAALRLPVEEEAEPEAAPVIEERDQPA